MGVYGYGFGTNDGQNAIDWDYYRYPEQQAGGRPLDYPAHLPWPPPPPPPPPPNINGGSSGGGPTTPTGQGLNSLNGGKGFGWDDAKNVASNAVLGPIGDSFGLGNYNAGNTIATVGGSLLGITSLPVSLALGYLGNQAWSDKYGKDGFWGSFWDDDKDKTGEETKEGDKDAGPKDTNPLGIPGAGRTLTSVGDIQNGPNQFGPEGFNIQGGEGVTDPNGIYGDRSGLVNDPTPMDTFNPEDNFGYGGSQVDSSGNSNNYQGGGGDNYGMTGEAGSGFGGFAEGTDAEDAASADAGYW